MLLTVHFSEKVLAEIEHRARDVAKRLDPYAVMTLSAAEVLGLVELVWRIDSGRIVFIDLDDEPQEADA